MAHSTTSIKRNFAYQMVYEILIIVLPIITSPYIARVIGAEGLGVYSYSYSVAFYFVLVSMLGIKNYGNRVIAQTRDDPQELDVAFTSIIYVHIIVSVICTIGYIIYSCFLVPEGKRLYAIIQLAYVVSGIFDISWFYFGIERFKTTVVRNITVKIATVACIFIFVRGKDDLWIYCLIMSLGNLISQLLLWVPLKRYVRFKKPKWAEMQIHFKPLFILFVPAVAISLYKYMDKIMLGNMSNNMELGFYENAEKIVNVPLTIIGAFGTVMLPKMANLMYHRNKELASRYMLESMRYVMCMAFALAFGLAAVARVFAPVFWGNEFIPSGTIIIGLSITVPFISFANVIRTQYLIPMERDKEYLISVIAGAIVNLIINSMLIPGLRAVGATIGTIAAEAVVCLIQVWAMRKEIAISEYIKNSVPFLLFGLMMFVIVWMIGQRGAISVITLAKQILAGVLFYGTATITYMYLIKDTVFMNMLKKVFPISRK